MTAQRHQHALGGGGLREAGASLTRELNPDRHAADDDAEEADSAEEEADRKETFSIAAAGLGNEESARAGADQPADCV